MQRFMASILVLCLCSSVCRGAFIMQFSADGSVSNYDVGVGAVIDIPVYLIESGTNEIATRGIEFIGVTVLFSDEPGDATLVEAFINPLYSDFARITTTSTSATISGSVPVDEPIPTNSPLLLGTFRFQGNTLNKMTTLALADPNRFGDTPFDNLLAPTNSIAPEGIDDQIDFSKTITITATPEPSSLVLAGTAAACLAFSQARRRRKMEAATLIELKQAT